MFGIELESGRCRSCSKWRYYWAQRDFASLVVFVKSRAEMMDISYHSSLGSLGCSTRSTCRKHPPASIACEPLPHASESPNLTRCLCGLHSPFETFTAGPFPSANEGTVAAKANMISLLKGRAQSLNPHPILLTGCLLRLPVTHTSLLILTENILHGRSLILVVPHHPNPQRELPEQGPHEPAKIREV